MPAARSNVCPVCHRRVAVKTQRHVKDLDTGAKYHVGCFRKVHGNPENFTKTSPNQAELVGEAAELAVQYGPQAIQAVKGAASAIKAAKAAKAAPATPTKANPKTFTKKKKAEKIAHRLEKMGYEVTIFPVGNKWAVQAVARKANQVIEAAEVLGKVGHAVYEKTGVPMGLMDVPDAIAKRRKKNSVATPKEKRIVEGWDCKCVDEWKRYYGNDATPDETKELNRLTSRIERSTNDDTTARLYTEAAGILHSIFIRQIKSKGYKIISAEWLFPGQETEKDRRDMEGEGFFGCTKIIATHPAAIMKKNPVVWDVIDLVDGGRMAGPFRTEQEGWDWIGQHGGTPDGYSVEARAENPANNEERAEGESLGVYSKMVFLDREYLKKVLLKLHPKLDKRTAKMWADDISQRTAGTTRDAAIRYISQATDNLVSPVEAMRIVDKAIVANPMDDPLAMEGMYIAQLGVSREHAKKIVRANPEPSGPPTTPPAPTTPAQEDVPITPAEAQQQGIPEGPHDAYHLRYTNVKPATIKRVRDFIVKERPWRGTATEKQAKFESLLHDLSTSYGIPQPTLHISDPEHAAGSGFYTPTNNHIELPHYSVVTTLHEFKHCLQHNLHQPQNEEVARGWSLSLFYLAAPKHFKKAVERGIVFFILQSDLEHPEPMTFAYAEALIPTVPILEPLKNRLGEMGYRVKVVDGEAVVGSPSTPPNNAKVLYSNAPKFVVDRALQFHLHLPADHFRGDVPPTARRITANPAEPVEQVRALLAIDELVEQGERYPEGSATRKLLRRMADIKRQEYLQMRTNPGGMGPGGPLDMRGDFEVVAFHNGKQVFSQRIGIYKDARQIAVSMTLPKMRVMGPTDNASIEIRKHSKKTFKVVEKWSADDIYEPILEGDITIEGEVQNPFTVEEALERSEWIDQNGRLLDADMNVLLDEEGQHTFIPKNYWNRFKIYRENPRRHETLYGGESGQMEIRPTGKFIRERLEDPENFDNRSFKTKAVGKRGHKIVIGCPKGQWDPATKRCRVGTRAQSLLHPLSEAERYGFDIQQLEEAGIPLVAPPEVAEVLENPDGAYYSVEANPIDPAKLKEGAVDAAKVGGWALQGAEIGSVVPGVGTAVGAGVGAGIGAGEIAVEKYREKQKAKQEQKKNPDLMDATRGLLYDE